MRLRLSAASALPTTSRRRCGQNRKQLTSDHSRKTHTKRKEKIQRRRRDARNRTEQTDRDKRWREAERRECDSSNTFSRLATALFSAFNSSTFLFSRFSRSTFSRSEVLAAVVAALLCNKGKSEKKSKKTEKYRREERRERERERERRQSCRPVFSRSLLQQVGLFARLGRSAVPFLRNLAPAASHLVAALPRVHHSLLHVPEPAQGGSRERTFRSRKRASANAARIDTNTRKRAIQRRKRIKKKKEKKRHIRLSV